MILIENSCSLNYSKSGSKWLPPRELTYSLLKSVFIVPLLLLKSEFLLQKKPINMKLRYWSYISSVHTRRSIFLYQSGVRKWDPFFKIYLFFLVCMVMLAFWSLSFFFHVHSLFYLISDMEKLYFCKWGHCQDTDPRCSDKICVRRGTAQILGFSLSLTVETKYFKDSFLKWNVSLKMAGGYTTFCVNKWVFVC